MTHELPKTMKAAVVDRAGPPETFRIKDVPLPHLARNHVMIALDFAGVGSWDAEQRAGEGGPVEPGTILGVDGSGTVVATAHGVDRPRVGEHIYSYSYANPSGGFYAEYVSVSAERVAPVPPHVDLLVAGAMPCVALTALAGLEALRVKAGQVLLVFGASGGVGSLAVWLAACDGSTVIGTARPDAQEYVRSLGAAHAIDAHASDPDRSLKRVAPSGLDAALVTANGAGLSQLLAHLKPHAPFAYPNGVEPVPEAPGHRGVAVDGAMTHDAFERLNVAIGSRSIPLRTEVYSLNRVVDAHRRIERGHVIGKIVLQVR
jgi:NADPH:quinone reductase-like Zn-dependent oxidoreductase